MWVHRDSQSGFFSSFRLYSPRHKRTLTATSTYLKIVTGTVNPPAETALEDQTTEIMDFVPGIFTGPGVDRILCAERMTQLKIARHRNCFPQRRQRHCDCACNGNRPSEAWLWVIHRSYHVSRPHSPNAPVQRRRDSAVRCNCLLAGLPCACEPFIQQASHLEMSSCRSGFPVPADTS